MKCIVLVQWFNPLTVAEQCGAKTFKINSAGSSFKTVYRLIQKESLSIITYEPLSVCAGVFICRDSALCLCFLPFFFFSVFGKFVGVYPHSAQVRSGLYKKVVTRCQTVSSRNQRDTTPENTNIVRRNAKQE